MIDIIVELYGIKLLEALYWKKYWESFFKLQSVKGKVNIIGNLGFESDDCDNDMTGYVKIFLIKNNRPSCSFDQFLSYLRENKEHPYLIMLFLETASGFISYYPNDYWDILEQEEKEINNFFKVNDGSFSLYYQFVFPTRLKRCQTARLILEEIKSSNDYLIYLPSCPCEMGWPLFISYKRRPLNNSGFKEEYHPVSKIIFNNQGTSFVPNEYGY